MKFIVGIKVLAFTSLILGIILLSVCGWTFSSFVTREIKDRNETTTQTPVSLTSTKADKFYQGNEKVDALAEIIEEVRTHWSGLKKFLLTSNGLALLSGMVQVFTNLLLLCTGVKGVRGRTSCWKFTHFILGLMLAACLIVPAVFDLTQNPLNNLRELFIKIKNTVEEKEVFDILKFQPVEIYYGILALDITVIVILIILSCCLMRNADYDYEYA